MSGEGMIYAGREDLTPIAASDPYPFRDHRSMADAIVLEQGAREAERADVLAYLARKRASATLVAQRSPEHADHAHAVIRQCEIFADDLRGGLHEGDAVIAAALGICADQLPGHADPVLGNSQNVLDAALAFAIGAAAFALGVLTAGQF